MRHDRPVRDAAGGREPRAEQGDRGGRDRGPRMPMADFDDGDAPSPAGRDDVGKLESLDSVLGEDRGDRRGDRRRPRRDA